MISLRTPPAAQISHQASSPSGREEPSKSPPRVHGDEPGMDSGEAR